MSSKKKILVVGGGFAGLGSIKSLKEEGFEPVCYEKTSNIGGTWLYKEDTQIGHASIMPTTVINHSKEMGALSDCIPDKSLPNYMRHKDLLKSFYDVGNKYDIFRHMTCNREVTKVVRSADYDETGRWDVEVKNTETGELIHETYDGVMLCVGHITFPKMVSYPGIEKFKGKIMHTHGLKGLDMFKNKNVVVIGIGCSGLDAAAEISNVASQVYLSTRNGAWVLPRVGPYGLPLDYVMLRRFGAYIQDIFGYKLASWYLEKVFLNTRFNHNLYNLKPDYPVLCKDPAVSDLLPARLITGAVVVRRGVKCFTENGVIFENETKVTEADIVVMATGYTWKFPFLEEGIVKTEGDRIDLYKCMYPAHLKHPSLVIIGFILPVGPGFPLGEMQCRWATQVFNGKFLPPGEKEMMEDVMKRYEENVKRYTPSEKMSVRVDYVQYIDEIGSLIGAKPNMLKILFTDPRLFWALLFGPSLPYQYRLQGPHTWDGARNAILTAYERVRFPFSGVEYEKKKEPLNASVLSKHLIGILLAAFWLTLTGACMKNYFFALLLLYITTWKGQYKKFLASLVLLPFYITSSSFTYSYLATLFVPIIIAAIT